MNQIHKYDTRFSHLHHIYLSVGKISENFQLSFKFRSVFNTLDGDIRDAPSVSLFQSRLKHFFYFCLNIYSLDNEHRSLFTPDLITPCLIILLDEYVSVCLCLFFCSFLFPCAHFN
jgi:hypothetical protein